MKRIFVCILFLLSIGLSAQTVTKNPGNFTSLKVFDRISVQLIPGDEPRVEIKGDRAGEVEIVNNNGELKLRMPLKKLLKGENIEAVVYYQKLESVEASEGSFVRSDTSIKSVGFNLGAKEGAEINIVLNVQRVKIKLSSGGIIEVSGKTDNQDIVLTSGAELDAGKFESKQTTITVNAGGEAHIFATDFVDAKVRAGGDIYIHGNPKQIDQKTVLGGSIKQVK